MPNENMELENKIVSEVIAEQNSAILAKGLNKGVLYEDIMRYLPEMKEYVSGNLLASLTMQVDMDKAVETRNKVLYNKLLSNPELKETIVNELIKDGIKYTLIESYKQNLSDGNVKYVNGTPSYEVISEKEIPDYRREVFMRKFCSFLSPYQIALKAVRLDSILEEQKLSEGRSR